jgi:non-heme chloroperoxidase
MGLIEVDDGINLYVEDFGEGPPLVFVHGGGVTHDFWDHQTGCLSDRFRTIAFDLRGCGLSDKPSSGYSVDIWMDDVRHLIAALDLQRPTVVGHGLGSHVALRLAAEHPDVAGSLVLAGAAPWFLGKGGRDGGFDEDFFEELKASWLENRPQAEMDLADAKYFYKDPGEPMRFWCLSMAMQWPLAVFMQLVKTLPDIDHSAALPGIEVPVLIVQGRYDEKNRYEGVHYLVENLPDAKLVTVPDCAHCPPVEDPQTFNQALAEFVGAHAGADAAA